VSGKLFADARALAREPRAAKAPADPVPGRA
jgi:hypothetical protein